MAASVDLPGRFVHHRTGTLMSVVLALTTLPLGLFLVWASISMIRQKWMYLLVADSFLPGKPSLAALPLGILMVCVPFNGLISGLPQPLSGLIGLLLMACLVLGLLGCFYVPRFLRPRWMQESDERVKSGTDAYSAEYRRRVLREDPDGGSLDPSVERKAP